MTNFFRSFKSVLVFEKDVFICIAEVLLRFTAECMSRKL